MPIFHYDIEQRSEEWDAIKLGKVSGSQAKRIMGDRGGYRSYRSELIAERITSERKEIQITKSMQRGIHLEPQALAQYAIRENRVMTSVGFVELTKDIGCSPDDLADNDGIVEIKCPNRDTHINSLIENKIPCLNVYQCFFNLWVCDRDWCDFVSYSPELPSEWNYFIKRVYKDEVLGVGRGEKSMAKLKDKVAAFVENLNQEIDKRKGQCQ